MHKYEVCLNLKVCHIPILQYQFTRSINVLWHNRRCWTTFTKCIWIRYIRTQYLEVVLYHQILIGTLLLFKPTTKAIKNCRMKMSAIKLIFLTKIICKQHKKHMFWVRLPLQMSTLRNGMEFYFFKLFFYLNSLKSYYTVKRQSHF